MRIRLKRTLVIDGKTCQAGTIVNIDTFQASQMIRDGLAMQDKSLDGAREIKASERKNT